MNDNDPSHPCPGSIGSNRAMKFITADSFAVGASALAMLLVLYGPPNLIVE